MEEKGKLLNIKIPINKHRRNEKNWKSSLSNHNCCEQGPQMDARISAWKFEEKFYLHNL